MDNPSIVSHVSVGVADLGRSAAFYDAVLGALGARRVFDDGASIAYGRAFPEFWIGRPLDGGAPGVGNGTHVGFLARTQGEVDAFWAAALAQGGTGEGEPGPRPDYEPGYYACFVRDPDGHKVEAHVVDAVPLADEAGAAEAGAHPT